MSVGNDGNKSTLSAGQNGYTPTPTGSRPQMDGNGSAQNAVSHHAIQLLLNQGLWEDDFFCFVKILFNFEISAASKNITHYD